MDTLLVRNLPVRVVAWLQRSRSGWLAFSGYIVLAVVFTYPLALRLGTHLPGDYDPDAFQHVWVVDHVKRSLLSFEDPYFTDDIYYPEGVSLVSHNLNLANAVFSIPFQLVFGLPAGYNIALLLLFALTGLTCYHLARYLTGDSCAAFLAGAVFMLSPHHTAHLYVNHVSEVAMCWFPLYVLMLLKSWDEPGWRNPAWGAVAFAAVVLGYGYYGLYAVLFVLLLGASRLVTERRRVWQTDRVKRLTLLFGLAGALLLLPVWPLVNDTVVAEYTKMSVQGSFLYSVNLFDFLRPSFLHPLLKGYAAHYTDWAHENPWEATVYIGVTVLLLSLLSACGKERRQARFWYLVAGLGAVMSLGPVLQIGSARFSIPMPYTPYFHYFPMACVCQVPARFTILTMLGLAVACAYGLRVVLRWRRPSWPSWARTGLVAVPLLFEYWVAPFPTLEVKVPRVYEALAEDPESYAIAEFPLLEDDMHNEYQYYQVVHRKKLLLAAYGGRLPPGALRYVADSALIEAIVTSYEDLPLLESSLQLPGERERLHASLAQFERDNFRYIFVHLDTPIRREGLRAVSPGRMSLRRVDIDDVDWLLRPLLGTSFYCDGIVVYPVRPKRDALPPPGCSLRYAVAESGPVCGPAPGFTPSDQGARTRGDPWSLADP